MKNKKITTSILAIVLVCSCLVCCVGCKQRDDSLTALEDTSFSGYDFVQMQPQNIPVTYQPINMSTEYMQQQGIYGEGCQWPVSFESSPNGNLMLYGIDVAGMYRSKDHGVTWQKCNTGFISRGIGMFGIDPVNTNHLLAVGLSGSSAKNTGMYISYDGGDTWKPTGFNVKIGGERYLWDGLEFDGTTYDATANACMVAYYSIPFNRDRETRRNAYALSDLSATLAEGKQGLYKSMDAGESFVQISDDARLADGIVKITQNGNLLIGNQHGLFRVDSDGTILNSWLVNEFSDYANDKITINLDRGGTADILKCYLGITGLDCVGNKIYAQTWNEIYTLDFDDVSAGSVCSVVPQMIQSQNYKTQNWGQFLEVSKSNPLHMVYQYRSRVDKVSWDTYWVNYVDVSFDGGITWQKAEADIGTMFSATSWSSREKLFIVDPSDDDNVLCFGSDFVMRSNDGGKNFVQASGISNMMCGARMHFNYFDDQIIFAGAQDYTGTVSLDGGKTFRRLSLVADGKSYGNFYDAFAADINTYFGWARDSWYGDNKLMVTHDGGATWTNTGIVLTYGTPTTTLQSHKSPDILFAGCYRSTDRGHTWNKMNGCICVSVVSYGSDMDLFGYDENRNIVVSHDDGVTWSVVFDRQTIKFNDSPRTVSESIKDLSYDHINHILYAVVDSHHNNNGNEYNSHAFYKVVLDENLNYVERKTLPIQTNSDGYANYTDIEVDPNCTSVVYIACAGNYFSNRYALQRSLDGGQTWQVLTANTDEAGATRGLCTNDGGYEASGLTVDPLTGKVLVTCGCYGFEWINPPYDSSKLNHTAPKEHTVSFVCDGEVVHTINVKNNRTFQYIYDTLGQTFEGWYLDANLKNKWEGGCVYNSMYLYAQMKKAEQVTFFVNGEVYKKVDIEPYAAELDLPQPQISGYVFAGWYTSKDLITLANFDNLQKGMDVYAGFYKTSEDVFDSTVNDYSAYITYSNQKISSVERVSDDEKCDNRCAYIALEKDCEYLVTFKMDVRCRYGLNKGDFVKNKAPDFYWIDDRDSNGTDPIGEWVQIRVSSGEYTNMLLFYYTSTSQSGEDWLTIRDTISCFKLQSTQLMYILN